MSRILAIPDLHAPVTRKGFLQFCKGVYKKHKCNKVVFIGDVVDWSAISFHANNPECPGPADEFKLALKCVQQWYKVFPKAKVCIGNHDARPKRLAESVNIPAKFVRDYAELWETPRWDWDHHFILDDVYYCHGHGKGGGINPAYNTAKNMGMSVVLGHFHSKGGVKFSTNPIRRWFGMDLGAGIDDSAFAFAYAKEQTARSILGVGVVLNGIPYYEVMPCGKGERYHDSKFKR